MKGTEQMSDDVGDVGALDGPEPIGVDRAFGAEEGRTLALLDVTVAYLDGEEYKDKSIRSKPNPLELIDSEGRFIGYGSLHYNQARNTLQADLYLEFASPDRLTIETRAFPLYIYPIASKGTKAVYIFALKLDTGKPTDSRIEAL